MPRQPKKSLYVAVDLNGRDTGTVLGIYDEYEKAKLASDNTAAYITIFEIKAAEVLLPHAE